MGLAWLAVAFDYLAGTWNVLCLTLLLLGLRSFMLAGSGEGFKAFSLALRLLVFQSPRNGSAGRGFQDFPWLLLLNGSGAPCDPSPAFPYGTHPSELAGPPSTAYRMELQGQRLQTA